MLSEELMFRRRALMGQKQDSVLYEARNLSFDGVDDYIDTGVYLFEDDVKTRDFEFIAEGIYGSVNGSETLICAKHDQWGSGFQIRTNGNSSTAYKGTISVMKNVKCNVTVRRIDGHITLSGTNIANPTVQFRDGEGHHWSLHLGCAIDNNGNRYRYAAGTIDHIVVRWL